MDGAQCSMCQVRASLEAKENKDKLNFHIAQFEIEPTNVCEQFNYLIKKKHNDARKQKRHVRVYQP